jgi:arylsulfatase A-like enzyme
LTGRTQRSENAAVIRPGFVASIAVAVFASAGCARPAIVRPNVLLVTIDTLRADHCSAYGYARPTTPALEALAAEGARVEDAYAPMATTAPAHASLFTGLYPLGHGVFRNGAILGKSHVTLAERLARAGYETGAAVSSFVLDPRFGFAQGFASYDARFDRKHQTLSPGKWEGERVEGGFDRRADATTDRALRWLDGRKGNRPFFLWVHYFDPHFPYAAPAPYSNRFPPQPPGGERETLIAGYDGEVAFADAQLARLIEGVSREGPGEATLVLVTADHGEGLLDHGYRSHGLHLYEEAVRVPLIVRWPRKIPPGTRLSGPAELVDLAPTILDLVGVPWSAGPLLGRSLAEPLRAARLSDAPRMVFLQRRRYAGASAEALGAKGDKFGVRSGRWKYIEARRERHRELFDLVSDPGERNDLASGEPDRVERLSQALAAWRRVHQAARAADSDDSPEAVEALRALGYVE